MLEIVTVWLPITVPHPQTHPSPPPEITILYLGHTGLFMHHYTRPAETSWLQLHVCDLYQSHVLFIEVKKRNHAISSLPSWKLSWRKRWLSCERDCHKRLWRFQKQSCLERGRKVRFSAWCKAQEAWSSGVSEWPAVQALIKYLQNLWLFLSALNLTGKFWWDSYPRPALLRFSRRSLVESSGYQGLNFPDPRTRRNTICYYTELREDDTGRPH